MKKVSAFLLGITILSVCILACNKNTSSSTAPSGTTKPVTLSLSLPSVKRGQPLVASLPTSVASSSVTWTVSPATVAHISSAQGQAMILFAQAGTYRVTATYSTSDGPHADSSSAPIIVSDSVYSPITPVGDTLSLANDQIKLTPIQNQGDSGASLIILAETKNTYSCYPSLVYDITAGRPDSGVSIRFRSVATLGTGICNGISNPASSLLLLKYPVDSWPNGTYPLSITLNNVTYTGSLTLSNTNYAFTWNYTSGVTISPLTIKR